MNENDFPLHYWTFLDEVLMVVISPQISKACTLN